jgi:hypothetical protein
MSQRRLAYQRLAMAGVVVSLGLTVGACGPCGTVAKDISCRGWDEAT